MSNSPYHIVNALNGKHIGPFSTELDAMLAKQMTCNSGWSDGKILGRREFEINLFGETTELPVVEAGGESGAPPNIFADATDVEQVLNLAVGAASVCWENPSDAGVFDSTRARDIAIDASNRIHELIRENHVLI